jgi:cell division protein FtsB
VSRTATATHRRPGPRITGRALALVIVVVALLVAGVYPLRTYLNQRAEITGLQSDARELEQANTALEERIRQLHTPTYLERLARECLGMVRRGEIAFIIVPKNGKAGPHPC